MTGFWALCLLEARTVLRDRTLILGLLLLIGSTTPIRSLLDRFPAPPAAEAPALLPAPPSSVPERAPEGVLEVEWVGTRPAGLPLGSLAVVEHAPVRVEVSNDPLPVMNVIANEPGGQVEEVRHRLRSSLARARRANLLARGLDVDPDEIVRVGGVGVEAAGWPAVSMAGALLWMWALAVAGSISVEAVPRRRESGMLEQLRSTSTREEELVGAWVLSTAALTTGVLAASAAALSAWGRATGHPEALGPALHTLPFAALVTALSIGTSLRATDVQSAYLRWFFVVFALATGTGLSMALMERPWLAALVPLGGSSLASFGWLGPWAPLADLAAAFGWTALLIAGASAALRREDSASAGVDHALMRRARGDYRPEALVLAVMGVSGGVVSGGLPQHPWVAASIGFGTLLLTPALLAAPVLGLPWRELLPLRAPAPRDVLLAAPMTGGMLAASAVVLPATLALLPDSLLLEPFLEAMGQWTRGPIGLLLVGLLPAVCEELLYRGAVLGLLRRGAPPWAANLGQAAAFALAHVLSFRLPWTFLFGLILGAIRLRTRTLWPGMALHLAFNVAATVLVFDATAPMDWRWLLPGLSLLAVLPLYGGTLTRPRRP